MFRPTPEELAKAKYTPTPGGDWEVSTPEAEGPNPAPVAELFLKAADRETLYGLLVVKNGRLVAEGYFNGSSAERKELLQSVTKSFMSALTGIALEVGRMGSPWFSPRPGRLWPVGDHCVVLRKGRVIADRRKEGLAVEVLGALMAG